MHQNRHYDAPCYDVSEADAGNGVYCEFHDGYHVGRPFLWVGQFIKVVRSCENPWHGTAPARAVDVATCPECVVRCAEHGERVAGFRGRTVHVDDQGATLRTMEPFCGPHYRPDGPRSA